MEKARGAGRPRTDIERAMAHYGITREEYSAHSERYPLPERGTGLKTGRAAGVGGSNPDGGGLAGLVILGLILWALSKKK